MPLVEDNLFGHVDKVQIAIDRLKAFEPKEGYYLAFSGGKDSQCIYHLDKMAGVKFDAHYSVTTVDPPELMRFIREQYPDVEWEYHYWPDDPKYNHKSGKRRQITMWNLIANHTITSAESTALASFTRGKTELAKSGCITNRRTTNR